MSNNLHNVKWGKPASKLLNYLTGIDENRSAILHIRHTERERIGNRKGRNEALSTLSGKKIAFEFGSLLPKHRDIRLFHTDYKRTEETCDSIIQGAQSQGIEPVKQPPMQISSIVDRRKYIQLGKKDSNIRTPDLMFRWISGLVPIDAMFSSFDFSKKMAQLNEVNLLSTSTKGLDIYVSHDVWISTLMFHWFAIPPYTGCIKYLDGFLMQKSDEHIDLMYNENRFRIKYPYWWPHI